MENNLISSHFYGKHGETIARPIVIKGIKKAVGKFNSWQGAARVYFDTATGEVWTMIYNSCGRVNSMGDTVFVVASKATHNMIGGLDTITMKSLRSSCEKFI